MQLSSRAAIAWLTVHGVLTQAPMLPVRDCVLYHVVHAGCLRPACRSQCGSFPSCRPGFSIPVLVVRCHCVVEGICATLRHVQRVANCLAPDAKNGVALHLVLLTRACRHSCACAHMCARTWLACSTPVPPGYISLHMIAGRIGPCLMQSACGTCSGTWLGFCLW